MTGKKYVFIHGFNLHQPNRGNAALNYGAISFLHKKGYLKEGQEIVSFKFVKNPFKHSNRSFHDELLVDGIKWKYHRLCFLFWEETLWKSYNFIVPYSRFWKIVNNIDFEAADYGGDGLTDIYGQRNFENRFKYTLRFIKRNIPLIVLPQTIGPFLKENSYQAVCHLLDYASKVYVRDDNFSENLTKLSIPYEKTKDLSAYMEPERIEINIADKAVGINVSGLAYSNNYGNLAGQFDCYPLLIERLICHFRENGCAVYLIPHSYIYNHPDINNDDWVACKMAYDRLEDQRNVFFVDQDLTSPQVKGIISRMSFFVGTRMHANFAAIFTNTPVYGLAYSYKFTEAFKENSLDGERQITMINNLRYEDVQDAVDKIWNFYLESHK